MKTGALYAIIVFLIGFILGTIRVLLLAPRVGETTAVVLEAPFILTASWFVCRWSVDRLDVGRTVPVRSLMGLIAFLVLMSAEVGLGAAFDRSLVDQLAAYRSLAGAIGRRSGALRHVPGRSGLAAVEPHQRRAATRCCWSRLLNLAETLAHLGSTRIGTAALRFRCNRLPSRDPEITKPQALKTDTARERSRYSR